MCSPINPAEVTRRVRQFFSTAPPSTRDIICYHARLNTEKVEMISEVTSSDFITTPTGTNNDATFVPVAASPLADNGGTSLETEGTIMSWIMCADSSLSAVPIGSSSDARVIEGVVDEGILCFIIDALTSAHLSVVTEVCTHVSVSLDVEFLQSLTTECAFTLKSRVLRVGQRICFLSAEIYQFQSGKSVLCAKANHAKIFYRKGSQRTSKL
ncbi:uncharacterized protein TM35_000211240 [Trypanosoma theileri]|uniref:Thioesterase domain-containing protein n=1 Tax=Trypanosoma theileri TaxID=67003 RepID=A0A1X0NSI3_9TRYP|nr:uncharacterized protein TM35_000211240 [Trypanosoma theileri]ORC87518.1 hypothetical protein TM35_000211240 [Trypanosoma theileri]